MRQAVPSTLRGRLFFLAGMAAIPIIAAIAYDAFVRRRAAIAETGREAFLLAESLAAEENRLVDEARQLLALLAQVPRVRDDASVECREFLAEVMDAKRKYATIGLARPDGMVHCNALPIAAPVDASSRRWFRRAVETGEFAIGDYQIGLVTGVASVHFAYPIFQGNELTGVVFAALPLTWLQRHIAGADLPPGSRVLVLDGNATVMASYPEGPDLIGQSLAGTRLAAVIQDHEGDPFDVVEGADGVSRLYVTTVLESLPEDQTVTISIGIPMSVVYGPANAETARALGMVLLALCLGMVVTWVVTDRLVLKPVDSLLHATRRLGGKDLGARAPVTGAPREIDDLATAFNGMADTLERHVGEIEENLVQIKRLDRVRAVLSGISGGLLRSVDREELLREACRISVEDGKFPLAWVAELDPDTGKIRVAAHANHAGTEIAVPDALTTDDGLAASALHQRKAVVSNDVEKESWGARVHSLGFRSAIALPLGGADGAPVALNLYTAESDFFTEEEMRLLHDLAADTSIGLALRDREEELHYLASYDPQTGLPNRSLFADRLRLAIHGARRDEELVAVILLSIDQLSEIHAILGHQAGDLVLRTVAERLKALAGEANTTARLASHELGVVLTNIMSVHDIERFVDDLLESVPREISSGREEIRVSFRIGVAVFPDAGDEPEALIRSATLALDSASAEQSYPVAFYSDELSAAAQSRRKLQLELRAALDRDEIELFYQPVVGLASGKPIAVEALARWHSPELGEVPPGTFIPAAEEMGIIREISTWVLTTAARQGRHLDDSGFSDLRVNVNVSVSYLQDPVFNESLAGIIEETGMNSAHLGIGVEITESALMENIRKVSPALKRLREAGIMIYIDDFGTGYSSLSYLRILPIDALKIDRSFIDDIPADRDAVAIVKAIIALAGILNLRVIAEGVGTEEQLSVLRELGCDAAQGFLFSRPLPADKLEEYLRQNGYDEKS